MNQSEMLELALRILEDLDIEYMVVGSFASSAYGEPRMTRDIDIVIRPKEGQIPPLCAAFTERDLYVSLEAAIEAEVRHDQFNVISPDGAEKIDFLIAKDTPWGREQLTRRRRAPLYRDKEGYLGAPEDVIISKMIYYGEGGSDKHLRDITGMFGVMGDAIDRDYIGQWADELGLTEIWQALLDRVGES